MDLIGEKDNPREVAEMPSSSTVFRKSREIFPRTNDKRQLEKIKMRFQILRSIFLIGWMQRGKLGQIWKPIYQTFTIDFTTQTPFFNDPLECFF